MATIKQIAQLAGVSRGTVDRVVNNRGTVKPETEEKIRQVIAELDYTPNRVAQALAVRKNRLLLGVVLFGSDNPFFSDVVRGIAHKTRELVDYGCDVVLEHTRSLDPDDQLAAIDRLADRGINGLVISPCNDERVARRIGELTDRGIPVVTTNTDIEHSRRLCYVGSDHSLGGRTAGGLMALITGGHATIGVITGFHNVLCHTRRVAGFREAIGSHPAMTVIAELDGYDDDFRSYAAAGRLLTEHPETDALYIAAAGVLGACRAVMDLGLAGKIPILCYDDVPETVKLIRDGVISATICQQPERQGEKPLSLLYDYLSYGKAPASDFYYTDLIIKIRENLP